MKVAVITDDEKTISQHFGRAKFYLIYTVENGEIVETEMREKMGHGKFSNTEIGSAHDRESDARGHGFGETSQKKHSLMAEALKDCDALIVRGMGRGAYISMEEAGIKPIVTDIPLVLDAVKAYIDDQIVDHTELLH